MQNQKYKSLNEVTNRRQLLEYASERGYKCDKGLIPLDFYKQEINIADFASLLGYKMDDSYKSLNPFEKGFDTISNQYLSEGSARWVLLKRKNHPELPDKNIVVCRRFTDNKSNINHKYNNHYYYNSYLAGGEREDHGSIIDLVQRDLSVPFSESLREIEAAIYSNDNMNITPLKGVDPSSTSKEFEIQMLNNIKELKDFDWLSSRGITTDAIFFGKIPGERFSQGKFENRVFNSVFKAENGNTYMNTAFPFYSEKDGTIGYESRNQTDKLNFKGYTGEKKDGVWRSNFIPTKPFNIVVTEAPLDAISDFQYDLQFNKSSNNNFYLSTGGSISSQQASLISKALDGVNFKPVPFEKLSDNEKPFVMNVVERKDIYGKPEVNPLTGEPIKIAHVRTNPPQNLIVSFDNDRRGFVHGAKLLAELQNPKFFGIERFANANPHRAFAFITASSHPSKLEANLTFHFNCKDKLHASNTSDFMDMKLNKIDTNLSHKSFEYSPFSIVKNVDQNNTLRYSIDFKTNSDVQNALLLLVKDVKFDNSPKLDFKVSLLKDMNEDLMAVKGLDDSLSKRFAKRLLVQQMYPLNQFTKKDDKLEQSKDVDDLMALINNMMDNSKKDKPDADKVISNGVEHWINKFSFSKPIVDNLKGFKVRLIELNKQNSTNVQPKDLRSVDIKKNLVDVKKIVNKNTRPRTPKL